MTALDELRDRSDEELIEEGRTLTSTIERSQLRLGRLALAFAPMGEPGRMTGAMKRTEMYAREIGADPEALLRYRATAHAWSQFDVAEGEFSYSLLRTLAPVAEKERALKILREEAPDGGWTYATAVDAVAEAGLIPRRTRKRKSDLDRLQEIAAALKDLSFAGRQGPTRALAATLTRIETHAKRLLDELEEPDAKPPPAKRNGRSRRAARVLS